jgi:fatty-acid desaturase
MKRIKERLRARSRKAGEGLSMIDIGLGSAKNSRAARLGKAAMMLGIVLEAIEPVVTVVVVMALASVPCFAQTGGTIFGQDQSMVPNAVRQTVIFAAGLAFLVGALTVIWGAFQYSRRQECMNCFIGGGLLMTIGGVIALISYLSSGRGVTVDRTLN